MRHVHEEQLEHRHHVHEEQLEHRPHHRHHMHEEQLERHHHMHEEQLERRPHHRHVQQVHDGENYFAVCCLRQENCCLVSKANATRRP